MMSTGTDWVKNDYTREFPGERVQQSQKIVRIQWTWKLVLIGAQVDSFQGFAITQLGVSMANVSSPVQVTCDNDDTWTDGEKFVIWTPNSAIKTPCSYSAISVRQKFR